MRLAYMFASQMKTTIFIYFIMSIIIAITEQEEEDDGTFLLGPNIIVFYWLKTVLYI